MSNNYFKEICYRLEQRLQPPTALLRYLIHSCEEQSSESSTETGAGLVPVPEDWSASLTSFAPLGVGMALRKASRALWITKREALYTVE